MEATINKIEVGTIFYSSWGYDQTNIDYFQVVKVTPKGVYIREIKDKRTYEGDMHGTSVPVKDDFQDWSLLHKENKPVFRRLVDNSSEPAINIKGYNSAWLWDGQPRSFSTWA